MKKYFLFALLVLSICLCSCGATTMSESVSENTSAASKVINEIPAQQDESVSSQQESFTSPKMEELPSLEISIGRNMTLYANPEEEEEYHFEEEPLSGMSNERLAELINMLYQADNRFVSSWLTGEATNDYADIPDFLEWILNNVSVEGFSLEEIEHDEEVTLSEADLYTYVWGMGKLNFDSVIYYSGSISTDEYGIGYFANTDIYLCTLAAQPGLADITFGEYFGQDMYKLFPFVPGNSVTLGEYADSVYAFMDEWNMHGRERASYDLLESSLPFRYIRPELHN